MDCERFVKLIKTWNQEVCIFGAGHCGTTWGYDLVKSAGFKVAFYCDNFLAGSVCNGYKVFHPEVLCDRKDDILCFISVEGAAGKDILDQVKRMGVIHYFWIAEGNFEAELAQFIYSNPDDELHYRYSYLMNDESYIIRRYESVVGKKLCLDKPKSFNEKLQWLKIHDRNPLYTTLVDKSAVKRYVSDKIGKEYVIPTLGEWSDPTDIEYDLLPERFVLKCTHDSGSAIICNDRREFDVENAEKRLKKALDINYYWINREWPYKDAQRKVLCEKYIGKYVGCSLQDFKLFCFDGIPRLIQVDHDRFTNHRRNLYSTQWEYLDFSICYPNDPGLIISKPKCLDEMIEISKVLSEGIPHVRVDLYCENNRVYFGELTFYHGGGYERFSNERWGDWLGSFITRI